MTTISSRIKRAAEFSGGRTLKGLLLEMKLSESPEERILAEELIVLHFEDNAELISALAEIAEGVSDFQWHREAFNDLRCTDNEISNSEDKMFEALSRLTKLLPKEEK